MSSSRRNVARGLGLAAAASLLLPTAALAQDEPAPTVESLSAQLTETATNLDLTWIVLSAILVIFMQAGFLLLELGFSRSKNVGAIVAKIFVNLSVASVGWWVIGFALAFGGAGKIFGDSGFFFNPGQVINGDGFFATAFTGPDQKVGGNSAAFFLFQFAFCAVSLAIVWGTTIERIKFSAYVIYGIVFSAIIYPLTAHWIFGGGWLAEIGGGVQDFAGSTAVHLVGATGGLAALLLLGPRMGKYDAAGKPRAIPGHSMPFVGLAAIILWVGWFGFNAGSTVGVAGGRFAEVALVTQLGAAGGVLGASVLSYLSGRKLDVGMAANGAIAGLVAITAPSGYVEYWAAPIIGIVGGLVCVWGITFFDRRKLDDPVGALSAHGLAGIWGTISCGLFTSERLAEFNGIGKAGLFQGGGIEQFGVQVVGVVAAFVTVFVLSFVVFYAIKKTIGLRVSEEDERAGLDISEHGMYGYPEQFIPEAEMVGHAAAAPVPAFGMAPSPNKEIPA
jgi:Amt family ammonium transporter